MLKVEKKRASEKKPKKEKLFQTKRRKKHQKEKNKADFLSFFFCSSIPHLKQGWGRIINTERKKQKERRKRERK